MAATDFRRIYDAHFGAVWHMLRRFGVPDRDVEDAAHEVFIVVYRRWSSYDPTRPLKPWLAGIAIRVASDHRKKAQNRREIPSDDEVQPTQDATQHAAVEQADARRIVAVALDSLDDDQRSVFVLHEIEDVAMPDIATLLDIPLNTAYSRLRLARDKFQRAARRHVTRSAP